MNVDALIKENKQLRDKLTEVNSQLQKTQIDLEKLFQEKRKIHRNISNMLALFADLGKNGLHQNKILSIDFKDEAERLGVIRILIKERIHDGESAERQRKCLEKAIEEIEQNNQNQ